MNLRNAILYRYERLAKLSGVVYLLMAVPCIIIIISSFFYKENIYNIVETIILFVSLTLPLIFGVTSYEGDLKFFLQNGVTRQQAHWSFVATLPICLAVSFFERVFCYIMSAFLNKTADYEKVNHLFADYFSSGKNFINDMLIGAAVFITLMSIAYMIKCMVKSFKPVTLILIVVALVVIIGVDIATNYTGKTLVPELYYVPQLFFLGSVYGERLLGHFIASLTIVNIFTLSVSHIITLKLPIKSKEV